MKSKPKNKKGKTKYVLSVVSLIMGAVCGIFIALYAFDANSDKTDIEMLTDFMLLFVGMYAAMFVQIIIHEAGHLVFGLVSGYRFSSFRILSFTLLKANGKLKLRRMKVLGTAGQCLMLPPDFVDGKIPVVLYNMGGSLMNLLKSSLSFAAAISPFS